MGIDSRVKSSFLGMGTVVKIVNKSLVMVKFDVDPPIKYNMGNNPVVQFKNSLEVINGQEEM